MMSVDRPERTTDTPREHRARSVVERAVNVALEQRIERVRQAAKRLGSTHANVTSRIRPHVPKVS
jgi:transcriptional regulator with GAF, ATPase, and Fis domain